MRFDIWFHHELIVSFGQFTVFKKSLITITSIALLTSACGGGSNSSNNSETPPKPVATQKAPKPVATKKASKSEPAIGKLSENETPEIFERRLNLVDWKMPGVTHDFSFLSGCEKLISKEYEIVNPERIRELKALKRKKTALMDAYDDESRKIQSKIYQMYQDRPPQWRKNVECSEIRL